MTKDTGRFITNTIRQGGEYGRRKKIVMITQKSSSIGVGWVQKKLLLFIDVPRTKVIDLLILCYELRISFTLLLENVGGMYMSFSCKGKIDNYTHIEKISLNGMQ